MIVRQQLLSDLQRLLRTLEADLLERSELSDLPEVGRALHADYEQARDAARTAQSYEEWRSDYITQIAAAWVLSCVFARFLEDNRLIDPPKLAGPVERLQRARDEHELYFRSHPKLTDRDFLLDVFQQLAALPGGKEVFGPHNPINELPNWLSGDAAGEVIAFFQRIDPDTGNLVHDFTDSAWDTRFLGDLYQDLSEAARKKYALLQTPKFVEEFILDRTLEPALAEFGLKNFKMIDPACGSGHFLLGTFPRLLDQWQKQEPATNIRELAQHALDAIHGVDVNPYAVAIARFRLLLVAMKACGLSRLADAPAFHINVVCGDSLLHGSGEQTSWGWSDVDHASYAEDLTELRRILVPSSYHSVVANPPYITPKDRALNQAYRERYGTCHMKYSLAVPFMERIFRLAVEGGFTGQITANSYMKREFGKKLIEQFLTSIDLSHVIDTSGAYIPGHGTPTVILFGRRRKPITNTIRTVMGVRGEPSTPDDPSRGFVWSAIESQVDQPGSQSEFVSVADTSRDSFAKHPWSIGGGGAAELKQQLEENGTGTLKEVVDEIGVLGMTNADEVMLAPTAAFRRCRVELDVLRRLALGDEVRDWSITDGESSIFPYRGEDLIDIAERPGMQRWLWPARTVLGSRATFARLTYFQEGRPWWEWHQIAIRRLRTPLTIVYGEVATHNHFVLDRGGKVFNRTAPVIKLPADATEDEHLGLLGLLNSSTACFWLKQVCFPKGGDHVGQEGARVRRSLWDERYAFNATNVEQFPLPPERPTALARHLDGLAQQLTANSPRAAIDRWHAQAGPRAVRDDSLRQVLDDAYVASVLIRGEMILMQDDLDWLCYRFYGLIDEDIVIGIQSEDKRRSILPGMRAFELLLAQELAAGTNQSNWFERHGIVPRVELTPPEDGFESKYQSVVQRRIEVIQKNAEIALIEQPEYKRRWYEEVWGTKLEDALRDWLVDRLECYFDFDGRLDNFGAPTATIELAVTSVARLADIAAHDGDFMEVSERYRQDVAFDLFGLVAELVTAESVPLLPILRYKANGLRKRAEWERTWHLQRQEDAIDARTKLPEDNPKWLTGDEASELKRRQIGGIPVPPKYTSADFLKSDYWRLRGKLDVPKERWISFPHCEGPDGTLVIAWAGYDHLQLARSISAHYVEVQERLGGRDDPRLVPLLACLIEVLPWLKQWHNEPDAQFDGMRMGDYFEGFVQEEARQLGKTLDEIKAWQPPAGRSRSRASRGLS